MGVDFDHCEICHKIHPSSLIENVVTQSGEEFLVCEFCLEDGEFRAVDSSILEEFPDYCKITLEFSGGDKLVDLTLANAEKEIASREDQTFIFKCTYWDETTVCYSTWYECVDDALSGKLFEFLQIEHNPSEYPCWIPPKSWFPKELKHIQESIRALKRRRIWVEKGIEG